MVLELLRSDASKPGRGMEPWRTELEVYLLLEETHVELDRTNPNAADITLKPFFVFFIRLAQLLHTVGFVKSYLQKVTCPYADKRNRKTVTTQEILPMYRYPNSLWIVI